MDGLLVIVGCRLSVAVDPGSESFRSGFSSEFSVGSRDLRAEREQLEDELYILDNQLSFSQLQQSKRKTSKTFAQQAATQDGYTAYMKNRFSTMYADQYHDTSLMNIRGLEKQHVRRRGSIDRKSNV